MSADSGLPMKASDKLRCDAVLITEEWKKQRMLDVADEVAQLEAENEALKEENTRFKTEPLLCVGCLIRASDALLTEEETP